MKKIASKAMLTISMIAIAMSTAYADQSKWPKSFIVGTDSQGGTYFSYGSGWSKMVSKELSISGAAEVTDGPTKNLALVHTGKLAFGMTTMGSARDALEGKSPLAPGLKMNNVCALFPMYGTPFLMSTFASTGIKSISDIPKGAKIGFGPAGSTSDIYFSLILEALGVQFERQNGSWADLSRQLQNGLIDVLAFADSLPVPTISQLEAQSGINIIELTEAEQKKIIDVFPVSAFLIKANTYKSLKKDVRSIAMWNYTIAGCNVDADFVYRAVKIALDNNPKLVAMHQSAETSVKENWDKNTFIPFHPGAVRYYEEKKIKIPANLKK